MGYLPEIPPLYMDMTVREYLNFVAELKKVEKSLRNKYVEEAMETTGITAQQSRLIRNLSKDTARESDLHRQCLVIRRSLF